MDIMGKGFLSIVGRLFLSQRLCLVCMLESVGGKQFVHSVQRRLSASLSVHYWRFHCILQSAVYTDIYSLAKNMAGL